MAAVESMSATRLYIGGLGERVSEEDIRNTFSNLGLVQSVHFVRTKGRGFAYIDFLPSSDKSLPKLFSTYNGCSWKGGKLKLEKAKEHYIDRLKREWKEDAELINNEVVSNDDMDENIVALPEPKSNLDLENMQLRLFFPKLRKVKALPFRGTGKHKYSFQRIQAPYLPTHFCDCPEHSDPVQTHKATHIGASDMQNNGINEDEMNMMSSVMNRLLRRKTSSDSEGFQLCKESQVHDSEIQDGGINEEEFDLMNSVMKKVLDRKTSSKTERKNNAPPQQTVPISEVQEETNELDNEIDDETDDDDIKINAVAGQNFGSFSSDSWDLQTSLMARSNEKRNHDDLARQSKADVLKKKDKPSNKKRKQVSNESDEKDLTGSMYEKKARMQTQLEGSEEHMTPKSVIEPGTKKSSINFDWSQKSAWKALVSDGGSSSFTLSQITAGAEANKEERPEHGTPSGIKQPRTVRSVVREKPKAGDETLSDSKEQPEHGTPSDIKQLRSVHSVVHEKPKAGDETPSDSKELPGHGTPSDIKQPRSVHSVVHEKPKPADETPSDSKEHEKVNDSVNDKYGGSSSQPNEVEGPLTAQPTGASATSDKATKGSSWLQKSSWTQLVAGGNSSSFSISQILPGDVLKKEESHKLIDFSSVNSFSSGATVSKQRAGETRGSKSAMAVSNKKGDSPRGKPPSSNDSPDSGSKTSSKLTGVQVSESCPFMRNADSLKDWMTAKTALSNSLKKGNNNK